MIKTLFFDIYQTLVDVDIEQKNVHHAWKIFDQYLNEINKNIKITKPFEELMKTQENVFYENRSRELYHRDFEKTIHEVFNSHYKLKVPINKVKSLIWEFRKKSCGFINLYPLVKDTLKYLAREYTLATASLAHESVTLRELEELDVKKYFSHIILSSNLGYRKPSKEFFMTALKIANCKAHEAIMIGDNLYEDIQGAKNVGIWTIFIQNPITLKKDLSIQPDESVSIDHFNDIVPSVKRIEQKAFNFV